MINPSVAYCDVTRVRSDEPVDAADMITIEEPLEIWLEHGKNAGRKITAISVTMRSPGNDAELSLGFLYTEGLIKSMADVTDVHSAGNANIIHVALHEEVVPDLQKTERNFYTSSSCGVCGKSSIESIYANLNNLHSKNTDLKVTPELIRSLPGLLEQQQEAFRHTGGLHASALFDSNGKLLMLREDAGRHNALDKLIGSSLQKGLLPLDNHILLLSGRVSFELMQKAAVAGIPVIAAIGAPSSLAVQMAKQCGCTLIGFLKKDQFNIYTGKERILLHTALPI
ncbi:MAG: formate dehydrogenase accessory sulfurtransferase FdhD [Chitinophagaceae bacterium]|nr:formate dehydrogenase accessory sulfurtransferase FdhD [Chitinophagaceae bacterium]